MTATAGVAERYPADLGQLLLQDPDERDRADRAACPAGATDAGIAERVAEFGSRLRSRTWDHMAREIVALGSER